MYGQGTDRKFFPGFYSNSEYLESIFKPRFRTVSIVAETNLEFVQSTLH